MRRLGCFGVLLFPVLVACGDAQSDAADGRPAYTWSEWVDKVGAMGDDRPPTMRPPEMSRWRPEDFLPAEYLNQTHFDACALKNGAEVHAIYQGYGQFDSVSVEQKLVLAERGSIEAQAGMGWYCYQSILDEEVDAAPGLASTADALEWARRGAASGTPDAMYLLGKCMFANWSYGDDPLWGDQAFYWVWRAAESLQGDALRDIRLIDGIGPFSYPTREQNLIQEYAWTRLWRLQAIFRRLPKRFGADYLDSGGYVKMYEDKFDERQMKEADAFVGAWLHANKDVWDEIYRRPASKAPDGWKDVLSCPGEPGHVDAFDYEGLNQALVRYGLEVSPPER